jgi:predicted hotdog family 3-hydroxylacyl-ACP dehydratase
VTDASNPPGLQPDTYLNHRDEMSLTDEQATQDDESVPDTLEVRSDSLVILNGVLDRLRRPALVVAAVVVVAAIVSVGVARVLRGPSSGPIVEA